MAGDDPNEPPPLEYASPSNAPREGWTTPRIFAGIFGALPGGVVIGLIVGGLACAMAQGTSDLPIVSFIVVLVVAFGFCTLAYKSKLVARLFFLGATVGTAMICLLIGLCGRLR